MSDLAAWLLAQIAEDERVARGLLARTGNVGPQPIPHYYNAHIYCMAPARVLADCEAKRKIVEAYCYERDRRDIFQSERSRAVEDAEQATRRRTSAARCRGLEIAVELLAVPFAGRPGYDPAWSVE